MSDKVYSADEVSKHTSADDAWVIVEGQVYDVSSFLDEHPGGKKILLNSCGKDSTEAFNKFHNKKVLEKTGKQFKIGTVKSGSKL